MIDWFDWAVTLNYNIMWAFSSWKWVCVGEEISRYFACRGLLTKDVPFYSISIFVLETSILEKIARHMCKIFRSSDQDMLSFSLCRMYLVRFSQKAISARTSIHLWTVETTLFERCESCWMFQLCSNIVSKFGTVQVFVKKLKHVNDRFNVRNHWRSQFALWKAL